MVSLRIGVSDQHAEPDGSLCCLNRVRGRQVLGKLGQHVGVGEKQLALYLDARPAHRGLSQLSGSLVGDVLPKAVQPL